MTAARFIAFEGLDGSGKSTLMTGLRDVITAAGLPFLQTREPGGSPLGDQIRALLIGETKEPPCPRAEALLYQAARAQHVDRVIKPALARGEWVLSDRFAASSLAFQAGGRAIPGDRIAWLNDFATAGLAPDLYVLLDLSVEESQRRVSGRPGQTDRFEREAEDFHERVRADYRRQAAADPERWVTLSATSGPAEVLRDLVDHLKGRRWLA